MTFLTDGSGAVTDSYDYDAWGILVASTGSTPNTRLYVGEEFDPDLGLINLRARQYKPGTGRFVTLDPLMGDLLSPLGLNRYLYANGDPVAGIDPSGLMALPEYGQQISSRMKVYETIGFVTRLPVPRFRPSSGPFLSAMLATCLSKTTLAAKTFCIFIRLPFLLVKF